MNLTISGLSKTYGGEVVALRDVALEIREGMFGLLGPNGAGKSTLMRILATLQEADSGSATLDGIDVLNQKTEVRKLLGYLPQEFGFYPREKALPLLDHFAALKGVQNRSERRNLVERLLRTVNLWDARNRKLGTFSGGMKQRFGIAQALIGSPKLIIVDEPTAGLDPEERNRFHNLLSEIGENIIVLLSTHIVDDVSDLCTQMAVIDHGRILAQGEPLKLISGLEGRVWKKGIEKNEADRYRSDFDVLTTRLYSGKSFVEVFAETQPDPAFLPHPATLEHVYFHILNQNRTAVEAR